MSNISETLEILTWMAWGFLLGVLVTTLCVVIKLRLY